MARKKKRPELELPPIVLTAVSEYLGPTVLNSMSSQDAQLLMELSVKFAGDVGSLVENASGKRKKSPVRSVPTKESAAV